MRSGVGSPIWLREPWRLYTSASRKTAGSINIPQARWDVNEDRPWSNGWRQRALAVHHLLETRPYYIRTPGTSSIPGLIRNVCSGLSIGRIFQQGQRIARRIEFLSIVRIVSTTNYRRRGKSMEITTGGTCSKVKLARSKTAIRREKT